MSSEDRSTQNVHPAPGPTLVDTDSENGANNTTSEEPTIFTERVLVMNMSNTLQKILDVLRRSTPVEKCGKDVESKVWEMYKEVSAGQDDDFLKQAHGDIGNILTFAGLFSAVNSTFIIGMQPNPVDTTNALMVQLIKIIADGSDAVDISNLSSSTGYSSSTVWMPALAYASLAFSLLAAFGAVVGKQWLNSYKATWGRGTLEERGMQRQKRVDGLEHLFTAIWAFLALLQISLFLFGLSVSANLWTRQTTISSIVICSTCVGILLRVVNIFVSVLHPDTSFATPVSKLVVTTLKRFRSVRSTFPSTSFIKSSAVRWILETQDPEVAETAAAMVLRVQWRASDVSAAYSNLLDNFKACRDKPEQYMTYGKAMAHLCIQSVKIDRDLIEGARGCWDPLEGRSHFVQDAFTAGHDAWDQFKSAPGGHAKLKHMADARTALRTIVVHGRDYRLSLPDDEELIWSCNLQWWHSDEPPPSWEEFEWLVEYIAKDHYDADDETTGDALLALSATPQLGSSANRRPCITTLIHCMGHTRPPRVRYAALRVVLDARVELAQLANNFDTSLLDGLSRALLTVVRPNDGITSGSRVLFLDDRDLCYFRLIFALAKNDEWCNRLIRDGHVERCISLVDEVIKHPRASHNCYLAGIFLRINHSGNQTSLSSVEDRWWMLMKGAWSALRYIVKEDMDTCFELLPNLVSATIQNLPDLDNAEPNRELQDLAEDVDSVIEKLQKRRATLGKADSLNVDAVLPVVQGLHNDLSRRKESKHLAD